MTAEAPAPFPFTWAERRPTGHLGRFVESLWFARGTVPYTRERVAPTGSTVAVFVLGDAIVETPANGCGQPLVAESGFLIGPHDGPVINEPTGETHAVGIVTTPVGCQTVFGHRPSTLSGRVVELIGTWGPAASLREELLRVPTVEGKLRHLEHSLDGLCRIEPAGIDRCATALALLEADPTRPIGDIAAASGVSHGHLDDEFARIVGLSPRALSRLLRMRRLLDEIDGDPTPDWSALAGRFGWFDQAHLIRDFKRHTGTTPSRYLAARREAYGDAEGGAGFVPEI